MDLISVIVPVYKAEKYLDKCVQSIVEQSYKNLEIILVDDGSPDNCGAMCDAWAERDARIKVIHKKNGGGAAARNVGLNAASGKLIAFVDSDDYLHPSMYQQLADALNKTGTDIVECNYLSVKDENIHAPEHGNNVEIFATKEALYNNLYNISCKTVIWNKLYKKEIVDPIRFTEGRIIDDEFFTYRVIGNASSVAVIDDCLYFYRQQDQSVMHQAYSIKNLAALEAAFLRSNYISARFPELASDARIAFWMTCIYHYQMILRYLEGSSLSCAKIRFVELTRFRKLLWLDLRIIHGPTRLWVILSKINFKLACRLRNLFSIGF